MTTKKPPSGQRLAFLDALRGIAAYYVVIYHVALFPQPIWKIPAWASPWVHFGGSGVTLFFVVSAFSLCLTMPRHIRSGIPLTSFFIHRFFRIAPLFYAWLLISYIRDIYVSGVWHSWTEVISGVFFVFNLIPQYAGIYVWAGWTVGVEMIFYVVFPLLYFMCNTITKQITLLLCFVFIYSCFGALAPYWIDESLLQNYVEWFSILRHLPIFTMGMITFTLWTLLSRRIDSRRNLGLTLIAVFLVLTSALINGRTPGFFSWYDWQGVAFSCLVLGAALAPLGVIINGFTRFLGQISYSVYLNHSTVIFFLQPAYANIYSTELGTSLKFLLAVALTTAIVVPLSYLTYRFIEAPGMRIGQRMVDRLSRSAPVVPAEAGAEPGARPAN